MKTSFEWKRRNNTMLSGVRIHFDVRILMNLPFILDALASPAIATLQTG
jgi:hypothetical protein